MLLKTNPKESVLDAVVHTHMEAEAEPSRIWGQLGKDWGRGGHTQASHPVDGAVSAKDHQPPLYLKDLWLFPNVSISQYCLHMHLTTGFCYFSYTNIWSEARQFDLVYSVWSIRVDNIFIYLNMYWYTFLCNTLISDNIKFNILFKYFHYLNLCLVVCCHWLKGYHVISNIFQLLI